MKKIMMLLAILLVSSFTSAITISEDMQSGCKTYFDNTSTGNRIYFDVNITDNRTSIIIQSADFSQDLNANLAVGEIKIFSDLNYFIQNIYLLSITDNNILLDITSIDSLSNKNFMCNSKTLDNNTTDNNTIPTSDNNNFCMDLSSFNELSTKLNSLDNKISECNLLRSSETELCDAALKKADGKYISMTHSFNMCGLELEFCNGDMNIFKTALNTNIGMLISTTGELKVGLIKAIRELQNELVTMESKRDANEKNLRGESELWRNLFLLSMAAMMGVVFMFVLKQRSGNFSSIGSIPNIPKKPTETSKEKIESIPQGGFSKRISKDQEPKKSFMDKIRRGG